MNKTNKSEDLEPRWYPFYTKSRYEKKVLDNLTKAGYEAYLPVKKTLRNWSDRKKYVDIPLFSSYIFVRVAPYQLFDVSSINGIVRYIKFNNRPAIVRDSEIELIKKLLSDKTEFDIVDGILKEGAEITITAGVLKGYKGRVVSIGNSSKVIIEIESINKSMVITVDKSNIAEN